MAESILDVARPSTLGDIEERDSYLLIERSAGGLIRATYRIYFEHFWTILLIFAVPMVPFEVLTVLAEHSGHAGLYLLSVIPIVLLGPLVAAALTIAVADLCLGRTPSVSGSYRRSLDKLWAQLLATNLLSGVLFVVGFILLIVPGVLFFVWYALAPCVVVLEGSWGWSALRRSKALAQGYFWRTLGILVALTLALFVIGFVTGFVGGYMGTPPLVFNLVMQLLGLAAQPTVLLGLVLIYYDLRVRKEAYDSQTLASDLMH